jgi:hypothetical protein
MNNREEGLRVCGALVDFVMVGVYEDRLLDQDALPLEQKKLVFARR